MQEALTRHRILAAASFSFSFGVVFKHARLAAVLAPAMFLATTLPRFLVFGLYQNPTSFHRWVGFFPGSAICFGVDNLLSEYGGDRSERGFLTVIGFLLIDSIILVFLGKVLASIIDAEKLAVAASRRLTCKQTPDDESVSSQSASTPQSVR